jgi:hypothetical protein
LVVAFNSLEPWEKRKTPGAAYLSRGWFAPSAMTGLLCERIYSRAMAESQELINYDETLLAALEASLSAPRLAPYRYAANGNRQQAMTLYLWNSRLSKAFLFPLNVTEVATRNAMHHALSAKFGGPNWILNPPFSLTEESEASRKKAISRLTNTPTSDDLVAALTFDFWSNLFRREYNAIWELPGLLTAIFPNLPLGEGRAAIQLRVAKINHFRNRIAHHEPIHDLNHREIYETILELIGLISKPTRRWVRSCSTIMTVVRTPPSADSRLPGLPLSSTNLRPPLVLPKSTSLLSTLAALGDIRPSIALVLEAGTYHAILPSRIIQFISQHATKLVGMIDLTEHTLADVIAQTTDIPISMIDKGASTGDALAAFFLTGTSSVQRPQALLVTSPSGIDGVILHPLIRYG